MAIHPDTDRVIAFLNEALELDRKAISDLVNFRVSCNSSIDAHPTIQAGPDKPGGHSTVGMLGILNGMCGTIDGPRLKGWGPISALLERDGTVAKFVRTESRTALIGPQ